MKITIDTDTLTEDQKLVFNSMLYGVAINVPETKENYIKLFFRWLDKKEVASTTKYVLSYLIIKGLDVKAVNISKLYPELGLSPKTAYNAKHAILEALDTKEEREER